MNEESKTDTKAFRVVRDTRSTHISFPSAGTDAEGLLPFVYNFCEEYPRATKIRVTVEVIQDGE